MIQGGLPMKVTWPTNYQSSFIFVAIWKEANSHIVRYRQEYCKGRGYCAVAINYEFPILREVFAQIYMNIWMDVIRSHADIHCKTIPLRWRHNGYDSVSNHQPHDCLLNRLFRHRSKKISRLRVTGICAGTVNSPHKWPVTRKMFPFDDVIMFSR